jgi:hypothetical protein
MPEVRLFHIPHNTWIGFTRGYGANSCRGRQILLLECYAKEILIIYCRQGEKQKNYKRRQGNRKGNNREVVKGTGSQDEDFL